MWCKSSTPRELFPFHDIGMFCRFLLRLPRSLACSVIPKGRWSPLKAHVSVLKQKVWCSAAGELMLSIWLQCLKWFLQKKLEWVMLVLPWQQIMTAGRNMKKQWVKLFLLWVLPWGIYWEPVGFDKRSHTELDLFLFTSVSLSYSECVIVKVRTESIVATSFIFINSPHD